ncbi:MAG: ArsA family ATPase [candidate division WOR-3 bacterium]
MDLYFFVGKGGTGKSTCSAIFSLQESKKGKMVLIDSIDPAHNLSQIFEKELSIKKRKVADKLYAQETDLNIWKKRYLTSIENEMKSTYKNQMAFNLNKYFKTLKYSPGLEEYAIMLAVENTLRKNKDMDVIIFDTPPTALFLNFLSLPYSSLKWLEQLSDLRKIILEKRELISRIHAAESKKRRDTDKVLSEISCMVLKFKALAEVFQSKKSHYVIVMNPDALSLSESKSIKEHLQNLDIKLESVIVNKYQGEEKKLKTVISSFPEIPVTTLVKEKEEIIGFDRLKKLPDLFTT